MAGASLMGLFGVWLVLQATAGRLGSRVLSWRVANAVELAARVTAPTTPAAAGSAIAPTDVPDTGTLTVDQVARLVVSVGLVGEAAVTATAIAMRESAGNTAAHNPVYPDDSYGLWQINRLAWPEYTPAVLSTARGNALAMLAISNHGTRWQPWQIGGNPLARTNVAAARAAVGRVK
jgi:hypothetical protein